MLPEISLVIPVYNAERYLFKALDSVTRQTFKNFEAIIVNDGSTDRSLEIAEKFVNRNKNFIIVNQKNVGAAGAKNSGIKNSRGNYIAFLDSDDFLAPTFLEVLYSLIKKNDADISCCNFNLYHTKTKMSIYMPFTARTGVYEKEKAFAKLLSDVSFHHFPWNKLYKKTLFTENDIEFCNMFYEDVATCPKIFYYANKVAVTSKPLYYYRRHKNSIIAVMDSAKINDYVKTLGITRNFLETKNEYEKYKQRFKWYAKRVKFQVFYCILLDYIRNRTFEDIYKNLKNAGDSIDYFVSDDFISVDKSSVELPYRVDIPKKRSKVIQQ